MTENIKKRLRAYKKVNKFAPAPRRIKRPKIDPKVQQQRRRERKKNKTRRDMINVFLNTIHANVDSTYSTDYINEILDHVEILEHRISHAMEPYKLLSKCLVRLASYCREHVVQWEPSRMVGNLISLDKMTAGTEILAQERQALKKLFLEVWGPPPIRDVPMAVGEDGSPMPSRDKAYHAKALFRLKGCPSIGDAWVKRSTET